MTFWYITVCSLYTTCFFIQLACLTEVFYLGGSGPCLAGTIDELVDNQYEYVNECPNDLQLSLHH